MGCRTLRSTFRLYLRDGTRDFDLDFLLGIRSSGESSLQMDLHLKQASRGKPIGMVSDNTVHDKAKCTVGEKYPPLKTGGDAERRSASRLGALRAFRRGGR